MRFDFDHRSRRLVAAIASGVLIFFGRGLEPVWWAAWLGPFPLLVAAFRAGPREAFVLAALAGLIGSTATAIYYGMFLGVVGSAAVMAIQAVVLGAIVSMTRAVVLGSRHSLVAFAFPTLVAARETLLIAAFGGDTAGGTAHAQIDALPVIQIASLAGAPGIVFAVALLASVGAIAWHRRADIDRPWLAYGLPAAVLAVVLGFGVVRLAQNPAMQSVPVGLLAIDRASPPPRNPISANDAAWLAYAAAVPELARQGARIIVLPENIAALDDGAVERIGALLARTARDNSVHLLVGLGLQERDRATNRAWLFAPDGSRIVDYAKQHLVPGLEARFTPGSDVAIRNIDGVRFGIAICKDMDFPALGRRYAAGDIQAMLVPAWDFDVDARSHAAMAVLRGVENGFSVFRAARNGLLTMADRYGRIVEARPSNDAAQVTVMANAPLGPGTPTVYARVGDLFGWLCVAGSVAILLGLALSPRRGRRLGAGVLDVPQSLARST